MIEKLPEELTTGDAEIDSQHLKFITYLEELRLCCSHENKKQARLIFVKFLEHIINHFAFEELVMLKIQYPIDKFEVHRQEHADLQRCYLEKFRRILSGKFQVQEVLDIFEDNFYNHLLTSDKEFIDFIQSRQLRIQL